MLEAWWFANVLTDGGVGVALFIIVILAIVVLWLIWVLLQQVGEWFMMSDEQKREKAEREEKQKVKDAEQREKNIAVWNESKAIVAKKSARLVRAVGNASKSSIKEFMDKHAPEDATALTDSTAKDKQPEEPKVVVAQQAGRLFRAATNAGKAFIDKHAPENEPPTDNTTKDKKD